MIHSSAMMSRPPPPYFTNINCDNTQHVRRGYRFISCVSIRTHSDAIGETCGKLLSDAKVIISTRLYVEWSLCHTLDYSRHNRQSTQAAFITLATCQKQRRKNWHTHEHVRRHCHLQHTHARALNSEWMPFDVVSLYAMKRKCGSIQLALTIKYTLLISCVVALLFIRLCVLPGETRRPHASCVSLSSSSSSSSSVAARTETTHRISSFLFGTCGALLSALCVSSLVKLTNWIDFKHSSVPFDAQQPRFASSF